MEEGYNQEEGREVLTLRPTVVTSEARRRNTSKHRLAGPPQKMSETNREKTVPAPYLQHMAGKVYKINCTGSCLLEMACDQHTT